MGRGSSGNLAGETRKGLLIYSADSGFALARPASEFAVIAQLLTVRELPVPIFPLFNQRYTCILEMELK
jgi:hypothetical protein